MSHVAVDGRTLKLSNLDKVLYPGAGFVKRDVIDYYASIAPVLLPASRRSAADGQALAGRRAGKSFFQKQAPAHRPDWVRTVTLPAERKPIDYLLAGDLATIVWLANLAALELHVPLARAEAIERPTALVFDLDPGEPATIVECCEVGLRLHGDASRTSAFRCFAKTSGVQGPAAVRSAQQPGRHLRRTPSRSPKPWRSCSSA